MTKQEEIMFGMSKDQILGEYIMSWTSYHTGIEMTVMGILSDAQHVMEFGQHDRARKMINIAKYILSQQLEAKMQKKAA
jgi:hypothetical protein